MIKKILIGLGIVVVIAGATIGVLYFTKRSHQPQQTTVDNTPASESVFNLSKDYGACRILETPAIKTALGNAAVNLQAPKNMGIVEDKYVGEGVDDVTSDSQICIYAFEPGGTTENAFNSGNAFMIQKTIYTNESGPDLLVNQIKEQQKVDSSITSVDDLGDAAFYNANNTSTGPGATYNFSLQIFTDKTSVTYTIRQSAEKTTFTTETGKTALLQLAQLAK